MAKVALVETKPSRTDFTKAFGGAFEFDQYQLCSDPTICLLYTSDAADE